jgi:predicted DsbA family dithiol-disulfide isomerase
MVREEVPELNVEWRAFSLEQQNSKEGPEWKAWEQGSDYEPRGLLALRAGIASREFGSDVSWRFTLALLKARHEEKADIRQMSVILDVAKSAGIDPVEFERQILAPETIEVLAREHERARLLEIFGTPTYVFSGGKPAFLKMFAPPKEEAVRAWEAISSLASTSIYFGELKRPQPPWPRGVFD